jgi:FkbM family methyltransferase
MTLSETEATTLLQIVNHIISQHPILAPTIEQLSQNVIYRRGDLGANQFFGMNNLDQRLEKYLNYNNGYFIELGANDGVSQSNTLYFEKNRNWRGILIEPTPHNYLLCLKNRSPENQFFCNACVSDDYTEKFVEILFSNLMSTPIGVESDIADTAGHAQFGVQFLKPHERVFSYGAVATTLNKVLDQSNAPKTIDFLSLDVEGAEIEVLKGVNHDKYRFKHLLVECRNIEKLQAYLETKGYELLEAMSGHDFLFSSRVI